MSRGPYKKKDTFDGMLMNQHFKDFLKVYLNPADDHLITSKEMLDAIEQTLNCFYTKHKVPHRKGIKHLAFTFYYGYAITCAYKGKAKQVIHSRYLYSYPVQKSLELGDRSKSLGKKFRNQRKVGKSLLKAIKKYKGKTRSPLLELLSSDGRVIGPVLSLSFAEKQKLNFENLPALKDSSFDYLFEKFNLSIENLKAHEAIDAGLKEFFGSKDHLPEIEHPIFTELKKARVANRFSQESVLNDSTLVEQNSIDDTGTGDISSDTLINNNPFDNMLEHISLKCDSSNFEILIDNANCQGATSNFTDDKHSREIYMQLLALNPETISAENTKDDQLPEFESNDYFEPADNTPNILRSADFIPQANSSNTENLLSNRDSIGLHEVHAEAMSVHNGFNDGGSGDSDDDNGNGGNGGKSLLKNPKH